MSSMYEKFPNQKDHYSAHADSVKTPKPVDNETVDLNMHIDAPKTEALDSNKMGVAVKHLNKETQRGEHAPTVGGYKHDPLMGR